MVQVGMVSADLLGPVMGGAKQSFSVQHHSRAKVCCSSIVACSRLLSDQEMAKSHEENIFNMRKFSTRSLTSEAVRI